MMGKLQHIADLVRQRNLLDEAIAAAIGRPATTGHLGEWIASQIFEINLDKSANRKGIDGEFRVGPLAGRTVNVKWYTMREGALDMTKYELDYYLVMTGPVSIAATSVGGHRPLAIQNVYLFAAAGLLEEQELRQVGMGTAASIRQAQWNAAEIYPTGTCPALQVTPTQRALLRMFAPA